MTDRQTELFQRQIPRLDVLEDARPVTVRHTAAASYSRDSRGRTGIRKRETNIGWEALIAECVCWLLARRLQLPVPDAAVYLAAEEERSWLSEQIGPVKHWDTAQVSLVSNLDKLGGILVLDLISMNEDRHAGNLVLQSEKNGSAKLWAIDSDSAIVGWIPERVKSLENRIRNGSSTRWPTDARRQKT